MADRQQCACCSLPVSSSAVYQSMDEMEFERGIWSAAMDGDLQRVQSFIQKGADPNLRDSAGYTALHYASRSGHLAVCSLLLQSGACASPRTPGGATPLHRSAYCGHLDVVGLLLQHRADPTLCDDDGATPLHKAAERGHEDVCQLLVERCPALCSHENKRRQLPYQLAPRGDLQELLKPPR
ncbi:Ankyrin repeat domain-containing protein 39 [Larimichthys crocea]|uniref:Ankyrin repeat domain-containing protein 39 n=2 Tax=Sciaenidae TaxID=30870 RepID=A0A6G0IM70_LARCR|nr:ankyrin repeat domain-containing protein 39 isoform X2 [Larimichthys crocea]KAE8292615.1 Ankyrin repeat domain-containing protein 39 [Larimichthys crocea]TKS79099.1 Ankyrin repeat domain-containing protein 39 [Collichthys lucidus]TMS01597.1 Ankyrin repeat domain-containing protein 39 [Larimichthys crocea]